MVGLNTVSGISYTILCFAEEKQTGWAHALSSGVKSTWRGSMCHWVLHITSESAQRKHGLPVANPKVYFSVINGWIRNSAQRAMQLLQSSYSGMINQSSCNTYWPIWQTNNIFQSFTHIPHKYSEWLISVTRRSVSVISWINVSLIWTSSAPGFIVCMHEAQTPRMVTEIEIDAFNQMFPRLLPFHGLCPGYHNNDV